MANIQTNQEPSKPQPKDKSSVAAQQPDGAQRQQKDSQQPQKLGSQQPDATQKTGDGKLKADEDTEKIPAVQDTKKEKRS